MAKHRILGKNGNPTKYYWSDKDGDDRTQQTVYKQTTAGIKRIKNVRFNAETKQFQKDQNGAA
jgi:hypothetical protein